MRYRIIALSHLQRQPFNKVCNESKSALSRDKIAVIIPCYNEALTIGKVIDDFRRELPEASVYVYDNNSTDGAAAIARSRGAVVRLEPRQGKGKVPDAYSETIGKVYVFDWSNYPSGSYRPRFNGNSLACCTAPYDSSTQIPSLGEGDYASVVFDNELSNIPQGNITYRWFKCAGLGSGAQLVAKELGSSPSLSLSGLQGSCINCEVTLTVNGKSKTFVPKAICNGKVSDGIYVRPRIG